MEEAETVTAPIENADTQNQNQEVVETNEVVEKKEETTVPLSALQKERKKRQEAEYRAQWLEEQTQKAQKPQELPEDDDTLYEAVTKKELAEYGDSSKAQIVRTIREEDWASNNPDKLEVVNEKLTELLKQKPHLAYAIQSATNRYSEAWDQLVGHGKVATKAKPEQKAKVQAPLSPAQVPKSAGVNQAMNLSDMTDEQYNQWRMEKRRKR
jgi:hypothetical protein